MNQFSNILVIGGIILIIAGLLSKGIPGFGRLPGDIAVSRPNFSFYAPITSMIILSIILTLILRFFNK